LGAAVAPAQHLGKKIKPLSVESEPESVDDKTQAVAVADKSEATEVKVVSKMAKTAPKPEPPKPETKVVAKEAPADEPPAEEAAPSADDAEGKGSDKASKENSSDDADDKAAAEAAAAEAEAKRKANLQALVDNKTYFLPINAVSRRRSQQLSVVGLLLIIVLSVAWLDLAADAGFIHVPILPLTHFFH
jgi:hypothetical protein